MDVHPSSSVRALQNNWEIQNAHEVRESEIVPSSGISDVHRRAEKEIGGGNIVRQAPLVAYVAFVTVTPKGLLQAKFDRQECKRYC